MTSMDITLCSSADCFNLDCKRNQSSVNMANAHGNQSFTDLRDSDDCPGYISTDEIIKDIQSHFPAHYFQEDDSV